MIEKKQRVRALGLCSGGLDSILAGMILKKQDIDVTWVSFETPFFTADKSARAARQTGIPLIKKDITDIYLAMLKNPPLGYGKHMNPCRDCHALMFKLAGDMMAQGNYDFLFSGEVAGQRPLSQTKPSLRYVEKQSGFDGLIIRPLSARVLPETDVEKRGLVDRSKLMDFSGRSRKPQIQLARELGIRDYPSPAGGCLLTDKNFSIRLKDLFNHDENVSHNDIHLLKFGRHIRLNETVKIIVGRTQADNQSVMKFHDPEKYAHLDVKDIGSPVILVPADIDNESLKMAAAISVGYTKTPEGQSADVVVTWKDRVEILRVKSIVSSTLRPLMLG
ncbi:MAG: tRNA 4-thiouridine(8) synthase ThiI [Proteobacteria bacterium]|nr:tRNA 4-thiouridine(8) synthase ThiI [Pseudomonadota bacterium]